MNTSYKRLNKSLLGFGVIFIFALSSLSGSGFSVFGVQSTTDSPQDGPSNGFQTLNQNPFPELTNAANNALVDDKILPEDFDLQNLFTDTSLDYQKTWEPWISKAATHAIAVTDDGEWMAMGTGYLHDNEIHIYRWNPENRQYDKVWVSGDGIISGDVVSLAFGDTDNNGFLEIIAGATGFGGTGGGGHVYVFEQRHIYDPFTNTENQFELVWKSPNLGPVFAVKVDDVDKDYHPDIIVGSWDKKVRCYEYTHRSGYPFAEEHWIEYEEVFQYEFPEKVTSIETGDTNYNALPEIIVGTYDGTTYILENAGEVIWIGTEPFPLINDNNYRRIWDSGNVTWNRIAEIRKGSLDSDKADEMVILSMNQGVYTLDYDKSVGDYYMNKLTIPLQSWETPKNIYGEDLGFPLDYWADWMIDDNETEAETWSVYNYTDWRHNTSYYHDEPHPIVQTGYTSSLAQAPDGYYSWFFPNVTEGANANASAIIDFGKDEEITSDARVGDPNTYRGYELEIYFGGAGGPWSHPNATWEFPEIDKLSFNVSQDLKTWARVPKEDIVRKGSLGSNTSILIDLDGVLSREKWPMVRYLRMTVWRNGTYTSYKVDAIHSTTLYRTLDFASSVAIGPLDFDYDLIMSGGFEDDKVLVGTVDGKILAYSYDPVAGKVDLIWNSYTDDWWTLGTNIWALQPMRGTMGKIPTWMFMENLGELINCDTELPGGFSSMTYTHISSTLMEATWGVLPEFYQNLFQLNVPYYDLVVGTDNGQIKYFPGVTDYDNSLAFAQQIEKALFGDPLVPAPTANYYYSSMNSRVAPAFANLVENPLEYPETMFVGWMTSDESQSGIHVWAGIPYMYQYDLATKELSGMLSRALETSQKVPRSFFADMDGDGDQDMIFTNGKIWYLENILNSLWRLRPDYFDELNFNSRGYLFDGPQMYDFDADGDLDLVVGIRSRNKNGTTYYWNKGTSTEPEWVEDKWLFANPDLEGNLAYLNHTDVLLKVDPETNQIMNLTTYNSYYNAIGNLMADYKYHNSLILGTNPNLVRVEINVKEGWNPALGDIRNYGYHVFRTWDNEDELKEWTFSMSTGDLDKDGNNEIIVGSYDSNAYVFEHLTNNTYKRAFRSPDLTHQVALSQSPYASDALVGLSGDFKKTFWDHVDYILAGMDLDGDGLQEFVAAADLSIFVFEATRTLGGYIRQDTYELIWKIDLRQTEWAPWMGFLGIDEVTALASGNDLNFNERGEFVVAAGGFMFVFESWHENDFREIYLTNALPLFGRYGLPGNPLSAVFFNYGDFGYFLTFLRREINAIAVGDTDGDKYPEIIIGGTNNTLWGDQYGFLEIIESRVGSFDIEWEAPLEVTKLNPINDIRLDDQDYDGRTDIIIGHSRGVDVWEHNGTEYVKQAIIPGSIKHPYYDMNPVLPLALKVPMTYRSNDVYQIEGNALSPFLTNGTMVEFYTALGRLFWSISNDSGQTWQLIGRPWDDADYVSYMSITSVTSETEPSVIQVGGRLWITFRLRFQNGADTRTAILVRSMTSGSTQWTFCTILDGSFTNNQLNYYSPSIWYDPDAGAGVSVSLIMDYPVADADSNMGKIRIYRLVSPTFDIFIKTLDFIGPQFSNNTYSSTHNDSATNRLYTHKALQQDMTWVDTPDSYDSDGFYMLSFAGRRYVNQTKPTVQWAFGNDNWTWVYETVDNDIWTMRMNKTFYAQRPNRVTDYGTDDIYTSITQMSNPGTNDFNGSLFIAFESIGGKPGSTIYGTFSRNQGQTWREKEELPTLPSWVGYATDYASGVSVMIHKDFPMIWVRGYRVYGAAVAPAVGPNGGYVFAFQAEYQFAPLGDLAGYVSAAALQGFYGSIGSQVGGTSFMGTNADQSATGSLTHGMSSQPGNNYPPTPGRSLTHANDKTFDRGYWNNIYVGTNPDSIFTRYDHWEATAVSAGDTDGDGFREVGVASRYQGYSFELRNSLAPRTYIQQFQSPELGVFHVSENTTTYYKVTDIELFDSNGNGFDEVIISTGGGNVYAFEIINTYVGQVDLDYLTEVWRDTTYTNDTITTPYAALAATDLNEDGIDDIIFSTLGLLSGSDAQIIYALNGLNGSVLWQYAVSQQTSERGAIRNLQLVDVTNDGIDDLIFSQTFSICGVNGRDGTQLWSPKTDTFIITSIGIFDAGGVPAFAYARGGNITAYFAENGTYYWHNDAIPGATAQQISSGNITGSLLGQDLVFVDTSGNLRVLNNTGIEVLTNATGNGLAIVPSPGQILYINRTQTMLLDSNGSIIRLLNRTYPTATPPYTAEVLDLNGDGIKDAVIPEGFYMNDVDIQAVDGATGELLWRYYLPEEYHSGLSYLTARSTGDDGIQIVVAAGFGGSVLDGKDGKPDGMYLTAPDFINFTATPLANYVVKGVAGNFGPLGTAALLLRNGTLIVVGPITQATTYSLALGIQTESMWDAQKVPGAVSDVVIGDFDGNGKPDDFVSADNRKAIIAFHGENGSIIWKTRAKGRVQAIAAGDINGDGYDDVIYATLDAKLGAISGASGVHLWGGYIGSVVIFDVQVVDHYSNGTLYIAIGGGSPNTLTQGYVMLFSPVGKDIDGDNIPDYPQHLWTIDTIYSPVGKLFIGNFGTDDNATDIAAHAMLTGIYFIEEGTLVSKKLDLVLSVAIGNFDSDSATEVAYIRFPWFVKVYDVKLSNVNWTSTLAALSARLMLFGITAGDTDNDGIDEIFIRSLGDKTYAFKRKDASTYEKLWTFEEQAQFTSLYPDLVDLDGDGHKDLLMKNHDTLFAVNGSNGKPIWAAFVASSNIGAYEVGDVDNDGIPDIVLGTSGRRVMAVEGMPNPNLNVGPIRPLEKDRNAFSTIGDLLQKVQIQAGGLGLVFLLVTTFMFAYRFRKRKTSRTGLAGGLSE